MSRASTIRFVLDGDVITLSDVDPTRTVLQYLREDLRRVGSKEGCAEGDCGACTVVVAELDRSGDGVQLKAINSCIQFLPTLDGKELITVESLSAAGAALHPVQQAMVDEHGSQCGFCTPGFVMSLYALYETTAEPSRRDIDDALAGNLCRCTGYRPIVAAATAMYDTGRAGTRVHVDALRAVQHDESLAISQGNRKYFAPRTCNELASIYAEHPEATLLAGGTDVGLWVTKQHRRIDTVIYTGRVDDLTDVDVNAKNIDIGGAATLSDVVPQIVNHYPGLTEMFRRFASPPIRNAGTLGGNIANGSPIGDSMAALMVVGTRLILRSGPQEREIALSDFYHEYQVNDLKKGEFVARVRVPLPSAGDIVSSQKWSKRLDQDISAVCTAYRLRLKDGVVDDFKMACGGMAATVRHAAATEAALAGRPWTQATVESAVAALADDFSPITDMRADAESRLQACQNLLRRFYLETEDPTLATVYAYGR